MNSVTNLVSNTVTTSDQYKVTAPKSGTTNNIEELSRDALIRQIHTLESELQSVREKSKFIAQELDLFRQRRAIFWSDRFRNTFDAWSLLSQGFQRLKDDTAIFAGSIKGYRLQPSLSMLRVAYLSYKVKLTSKNLSGVLLAPVVEFPLQKGDIVLQIFGDAKVLLVEKAVSVTQISDEGPVIFQFPPLATSAQEELTLHIFAQNVDVPIRLLEMRRYELGGFGSLSTRCFAGFIFAEE